jgi:hypothetical protein
MGFSEQEESITSRIPQIAVDPDNDLGHSAVSDRQSYFFSHPQNLVLKASSMHACCVSIFTGKERYDIFSPQTPKDVTIPDTYPFPNMMYFSAGFVFFINRSEKSLLPNFYASC